MPPRQTRLSRLPSRPNVFGPSSRRQRETIRTRLTLDSRRNEGETRRTEREMLSRGEVGREYAKSDLIQCCADRTERAVNPRKLLLPLDEGKGVTSLQLSLSHPSIRRVDSIT